MSTATWFKVSSKLKQIFIPRYFRLVLPLIVILLASQSATQALVINTLADVFWQAGVFVAFTLSIYHLYASRLRQLSWISDYTTNPYWQIVFASLLGTLPGCGGAIIVMTQYTRGNISFAAVVAVLTATMGDAAFLLIASQPDIGALVLGICMVTGIMSGLIVQQLSMKGWLNTPTPTQKPCQCHQEVKGKTSILTRVLAKTWQLSLVPFTLIALMMAFQLSPSDLTGIPEQVLTVVGAAMLLLSLLSWAITSEVESFESLVAEDKKRRHTLLFQKVTLDTNFIVTWVALALLIFELLLIHTQLDLQTLFAQWHGMMPLMGVLIGLIPGCGPQMMTTSFYLSGSIPLSAQLGNAISNDGDALFPAIALDPRAAIVATLYSSLPALIVAYGYYYLFEY